jgi:hypothetical protein
VLAYTFEPYYTIVGRRERVPAAGEETAGRSLTVWQNSRLVDRRIPGKSAGLAQGLLYATAGLIPVAR